MLCLQDEGIDCSSHCMRALCGILKVVMEFPYENLQYPTQMLSYNWLNFMQSSKGAWS